MVKKLVIASCFFLLAIHGTWAQMARTVDSLYFNERNRSLLPYFFHDISQLEHIPFSDAGKVDVSYSMDRGGFKRPQQSYEQKLFALNAEGIHRIRRFTVAGQFAFNYQWDDSLGYNLKRRNDAIETPYYLFAGSAGKYLFLHYDLSGSLSYALVPDKWYVGGEVHLQHNKTTRSVDPRPEVNYYKLEFNPQISYRWGDQQAGIKVGGGYGNELNGIRYVSDRYGDDPRYQDKMSYYMFGMADYVIASRIAKFRRDQRYRLLGANYSLLKANGTRVNGFMDYHREKQLNQTVNAYEELGSEYASYTLETLNLSAMAQWNGGRRGHLLEIKGQLQSGLSHLDSIPTTPVQVRNLDNYSYERSSVALDYLTIGNETDSWYWHYGLAVAYAKTEQADYTVAQRYSYAHLSFGPRFVWLKGKSLSARWRVSLDPRFTKNMDASVSIPSSQVNNYYNNNVLIPDYYYQSSDRLSLSSEVNYSNSLWLKGLNTGISLKAIYEKAFEPSEFSYTLPLNMGTNRWHISLGCQVYF